MSAPHANSPGPSNSTAAGHIVHGGLSPLAGPSGHSPRTSPKGATLTMDEDTLNSILNNNKVSLETQIRDLQPWLKDVIHKENDSQTKSLSESFSAFIHTEVRAAVSDSLADLGKESTESVVAGLETRVGEIKNSIARDFKVMETGLQDHISRSIDMVLKSNNTVVVQSIVDHLHHPDSAVQKAATLLTLKANGLDAKVTQNSKDVANVMSCLESLERRHGMAVDAFSKIAQGLQADVKELQTNIPPLLLIEAGLNRIYSRILELERAVKGESLSAIAVSRLTDNI